jgi:hypothetical protein
MEQGLGRNDSTSLVEHHQRPILTSPEFTIKTTGRLDEPQIEYLYGMLSSGFEELNEGSLQKQDMTFEEFRHDALNPDVVKFITGSNDSGDQLIATGMGHIGLDDIVWVNQAFLRDYRDRLIEHPDEKGTYYIGTIVVDTDQRGLRAGLLTIEAFARYFYTELSIRDNNAIAFFDHAGQNDFLPGVIQSVFDNLRTGDGFPEVEVLQIGQHNWHAADLSNFGAAQDDGYEPQPLNNGGEGSYDQYVEQSQAKGLNKTPAPVMLDAERYAQLLADETVLKFREEETDTPIFVHTNLPQGFSEPFCEQNFSGKQLIYIPSIQTYYPERADEILRLLAYLVNSQPSIKSDGVVFITDTIPLGDNFSDSKDVLSELIGVEPGTIDTQKYWSIQLARNQ